MKARTLPAALVTALSPLALGACAAAYGEASPAPQPLPPQPQEQSAAPVAKGVVATADFRATAAGEEILAAGGSATDAAIAIMLALTVVEPQSSGIGGGGFFVRGTPDGNVVTYDGREKAPLAATPDWFLDAEGNPLPGKEATISGLSVGVPGNVALAKLAHERHGKLEWARLVEPAIRLARDGFVVNPRLVTVLEGRLDRAGYDAKARATFFEPDGTPKAVGTTIRQPELAATLTKLAEEGPGSFYSGDFAAGLARHVAADTPRAQTMTASDVEQYEPAVRDAVCGSYRGYRVCGMGPPSSGGIAVLQMLGQLERFDLASMGPRSVEAWHLFLESQRLAYTDRELYTGDADFVDVPVSGLVDPAYLAGRSLLLDPKRRSEDFAPGTPEGAPQARAVGGHYPESGTTHFVTIGPDGTMVSYTSTIEGAFGSGLMYRGFYLNNELTDFSFSPERGGVPVANRVEGGKRPRSSMSPTVVYDPSGRPFLAVGAAGGPTIPIQTARAIVGVIDFGLPLREALAQPMIMGFGDRVIVEDNSWLEEAMPQLAALGHTRIETSDFLYRTNGALRTDDGWEAVYDPRLDSVLRLSGAE